MFFPYPDFTTDVISVSEFRTKITDKLEQITKSKRPIIITSNGKSTAAVLDIETFKEWMLQSEELNRIVKGREDISQGKVMSFAEIKKKHKKW